MLAIAGSFHLNSYSMESLENKEVGTSTNQLRDISNQLDAAIDQLEKSSTLSEDDLNGLDLIMQGLRGSKDKATIFTRLYRMLAKGYIKDNEKNLCILH